MLGDQGSCPINRGNAISNKEVGKKERTRKRGRNLEKIPKFLQKSLHTLFSVLLYIVIHSYLYFKYLGIFSSKCPFLKVLENFFH